MHAAGWIRLDWEAEVLIDPVFLPPNPTGILVVGLKGIRGPSNPQSPFSLIYLFDLHFRSTHLRTRNTLQAPASHMVRASQHAGTNGLRHPSAIDEVANGGLDANQLLVLNLMPSCILRVNPHRVSVRNLVEEFSVG